MKQFITYLFLFCFSNLFGQFAIVNDNDSLLNVREDGQQNSKVVDKLQNGHLIYCFENKGNWTNIDYAKNGKELNGYIYKDRYKLISSFKTIPRTLNKENIVIFKSDSIQVTVTKSSFDKKKHKFKYVKEYPKQIELIDNKKYWGTDGEIPNEQFDKITIKIGQKIIELPKKSIESLYEPNIQSVKVYYDKSRNTYYIQSMNSDGAGSYFAIWKIDNDKYSDRLIAYGF
jgi:hypothetical protein